MPTSPAVPVAIARRETTRRAVASCLLTVCLAVSPAGPGVTGPIAHAQGIDSPAPRVLNRRGDAVDNLLVWADIVQSHEANSFDASAARIAAWTPQQLRDLGI